MLPLFIFGVLLQTAASQNSDFCRICREDCIEVPREDGGCPGCICNGILLSECEVPSCPATCYQRDADGCVTCHCNQPQIICPQLPPCPKRCQQQMEESGCPVCACPENAGNHKEDEETLCPSVPACPLGCLEDLLIEGAQSCIHCNCTLIPEHFGPPQETSYDVLPPELTRFILNDPHSSAFTDKMKLSLSCGETHCPDECRLCVGEDGCGRCLCGRAAYLCPPVPACRAACIAVRMDGCRTCTCPETFSSLNAPQSMRPTFPADRRSDLPLYVIIRNSPSWPEAILRSFNRPPITNFRSFIPPMRQPFYPENNYRVFLVNNKNIPETSASTSSFARKPFYSPNGDQIFIISSEELESARDVTESGSYFVPQPSILSNPQANNRNFAFNNRQQQENIRKITEEVNSFVKDPSFLEADDRIFLTNTEKSQGDTEGNLGGNNSEQILTQTSNQSDLSASQQSSANMNSNSGDNFSSDTEPTLINTNNQGTLQSPREDDVLSLPTDQTGIPNNDHFNNDDIKDTGEKILNAFVDTVSELPIVNVP